nr:ParB N-terminal domain-containing protein [uncultured Blautia sp.]
MNNEIIFLTKEQIEVNPLNNWDNGNLRDLVDSIKTLGLVTPLSVIGPMENGLYRLISGERRYKSICEITAKTKEEFSIPCYIVGTSEMSEEMQCILIETANLEVRETDTKTINEHRANVMEQLLILSDNAEIKEHNVASKAAEIFKTSDTYARFWQRVFRKGIPPLKEMVKSGDLGVKTANQIANHTEEEQKKAVKEIEQYVLAKNDDFLSDIPDKTEPRATIQDIIENISSEEDTMDKLKREAQEKERPLKEQPKQAEPSFLDMNDEDLDIEIDQDIEAEFNAMFNKTSPKKEMPSSAPVKPAKPEVSFCDLENFNPFDADTGDYDEEPSYNTYRSDEHVTDTMDDEYMEKLNIVHSWCKEIMKKDDLTDEEWHVVEACKEVVDCFM